MALDLIVCSRDGFFVTAPLSEHDYRILVEHIREEHAHERLELEIVKIV